MQKKILIVEDEPDIAAMMQMLLGDAGFKAEIALGGQKGLEQIRKKGIDLVLLDIRMPDVSGREVLSIMEKEKIKLPVIVVTAVAATMSVKSELEQRFKIDGFVSKTYMAQDLVKEIKRVLASKK